MPESERSCLGGFLLARRKTMDLRLEAIEATHFIAFSLGDDILRPFLK